MFLASIVLSHLQFGDGAAEPLVPGPEAIHRYVSRGFGLSWWVAQMRPYGYHSMKAHSQECLLRIPNGLTLRWC